MAKSIEWSPEALEDIESIAGYIARDSVHYARMVVSKIFESADLTAEQPDMGREVPELGKPEIRERFVYSYRVIYEIFPDSILFIAVVHGARKLENHLIGI